MGNDSVIAWSSMELIQYSNWADVPACRETFSIRCLWRENFLQGLSARDPRMFGVKSGVKAKGLSWDSLGFLDPCIPINLQSSILSSSSIQAPKDAPNSRQQTRNPQASGMGLAVAEALAYAGEWTLHLLDLNAERGTSAASSLPDAHFHQTDVNSYLSLSTTFDTVFNSASRIDFVFANAGIVERDNFYAVHAQSPPPEPNQLSIDINLKGVVNTTYLAQHYFRLSPGGGRAARSS
ncbi:hypothetical protein H2199_007967 [Coniosporium tulheliwenetii]|uniref:Uncharacterized protein n=1 Tax=Coniosporium tulheliwenetii TaxID=3383036 RepID=A0ACC2YMB7_9PEZI|nr:hypothetical protein H2199_007967 [Cladosporium sp. JES 115]